jgi:HipA-like C-terminal domain
MSALTDRLQHGAVSAGVLTKALKVSPATLMRRVRLERGKVLVLGRGRATRYALRREVKGLDTDLPLLRIDSSGKPSSGGDLVVLASDEIAWMPAGMVFKGLPPEMADVQPSGFMGRAFARKHADLALPQRISDWSNDHALLALSRRGEDLPGNLILGRESIDRWFASRLVAVTRDDFPRLASAAIAGDPPGSSAGGERPKFGAFVDDRHTMVKFASGDDSSARRWKELLFLEALALAVLREGGVDAADAAILEREGGVFLEVLRFDRFGERGRRAVMSLASVHQDPSVSWAAAAQSLAAQRRLSHDDARRLRLYEAFARMIGNVDRHHHNVCLFPEFDRTSVEPARYLLAPAFDQLPMLYAPTSDGQIVERKFVPSTATADTWDVWDEAASLAIEFWKRAGKLQRLSNDMKDIAVMNLASLTG